MWVVLTVLQRIKTISHSVPDRPIETPSRIINAPCFLPNTFAGPYWVIAAGPESYNYSWAIVSGGPPTVKYKDGNCSTSEQGTNGSGLWLFTRTIRSTC